MKIRLSSVMVDDQDKALAFYTGVLGFVKKTDIPAGSYRWLTVGSPDEREKAELVLEPTAFPPAKTYQKELFDAGIPATAFAVDDIQAEYERMLKLGVTFKSAPTKAGPATIVLFEDTCGNLIQLYEVK
jgi:catechol 2,3-dioxygenase-like lactoylglutathione lyase family enzyme